MASRYSLMECFEHTVFIINVTILKEVIRMHALKMQLLLAKTNVSYRQN